MEYKLGNFEEGSIGIAFRISQKANTAITESCSRSGRSKKTEAAMRLEDHLRRYKSITEIGIVSED